MGDNSENPCSEKTKDTQYKTLQRSYMDQAAKTDLTMAATVDDGNPFCLFTKTTPHQKPTMYIKEPLNTKR